MENLDGRAARWFDCDWDNEDGNIGCGMCRVCRYLDFLDFAYSVGKPEGSTISHEKEIDKYLELKTIDERQKFISGEIDRKKDES